MGFGHGVGYDSVEGCGRDVDLVRGVGCCHDRRWLSVGFRGRGRELVGLCPPFVLPRGLGPLIGRFRFCSCLNGSRFASSCLVPR